MQLWVREHPCLEAIGVLPEGVELHLIPARGALPPGIEEAEFLVPPHQTGRVLDRLSQMRSLRVIQTVTSGVEWLLPMAPPGVTVCSARGTRDIPVAEWVVAALLAWVKELPRLWEQQRRRVWKPALLGELAGRQVLIVGYGSIGRAVEARLQPFDVAIRRVDLSGAPGVHGVDELASLLPAADAVIVLVPHTDETTHLLDRAMLSRLAPGTLLINPARGSVVDTVALRDLLAARRIFAALDVTDPEPLPSNHPLWTAPGLFLTPHLAGDSHEAEHRIYRLVGEQVRRYVAGGPLLNVVAGGAFPGPYASPTTFSSASSAR